MVQRVSLYHALVEPHLIYCCSVWCAAMNTLREKVTVVQRKTVRAITDYKKHVTDDLFASLKITPVFERWRQLEALWLVLSMHKFQKIECLGNGNLTACQVCLLPFRGS